MGLARRVFVGLAWLFVLAVAIQFLLAGLGVLGGESLEPHRQWGFTVLRLIPILMLIAAIVGRLGGNVIASTAGLFVLVFVQPIFAAAGLEPTWLRSFHVLNAFVISALGLYLVQRGTRAVRSASGTASGRR